MSEKCLDKKYPAPSDQAVCINFSVNKIIQNETAISSAQHSMKVKGQFSQEQHTTSTKHNGACVPGSANVNTLLTLLSSTEPKVMHVCGFYILHNTCKNFCSNLTSVKIFLFSLSHNL